MNFLLLEFERFKTLNSIRYKNQMLKISKAHSDCLCDVIFMLYLVMCQAILTILTTSLVPSTIIVPCLSGKKLQVSSIEQPTALTDGGVRKQPCLSSWGANSTLSNPSYIAQRKGISLTSFASRVFPQTTSPCLVGREGGILE